jgi:hypothetical protein
MVSYLVCHPNGISLRRSTPCANKARMCVTITICATPSYVRLRARAGTAVAMDTATLSIFAVVLYGCHRDTRPNRRFKSFG